MKYAHGVLDLETLGNTSNAPIVQIGISLPDERGFPGQHVFNGKVDYVEDDDKYGFVSDESTKQWWNTQDEKVRSMVFGSSDNKHHMDLEDVLLDMINFFKRYKETHNVHEILLWSHATFDPPILMNTLNKFPKLQDLFNDCIHFRDLKDFRTTDWLLDAASKGHVYEMANTHTKNLDLVHHYAPHDAVYEHYVLYYTQDILKDALDEYLDTSHLHLFGNITLPPKEL